MGRPSTKIKISCETCKEIFSFSPSHKRRYCSLSCFFKAKKKLLPLNAKCKYCRIKFHVKPSKFKWGKGKFCSLECYSKSQRNRIQLICQECKESFMTFPSKVKDGRKYCSDECSRKAHTGEGNAKWVESVKLICEFCKKIFYMKPWETRAGNGRRYCSQFCQYEGIKGENHPNWLGGISWEPYGMDFNNALKERIRKRDNYTCQVDECNEKQNGRKFPVHHIDYCKQNNEEYNLITLCHSHHNKSNFNREYWEDYFKTVQLGEKHAYPSIRKQQSRINGTGRNSRQADK